MAPWHPIRTYTSHRADTSWYLLQNRSLTSTHTSCRAWCYTGIFRARCPCTFYTFCRVLCRILAKRTFCLVRTRDIWCLCRSCTSRFVRDRADTGCSSWRCRWRGSMCNPRTIKLPWCKSVIVKSQKISSNRSELRGFISQNQNHYWYIGKKNYDKFLMT